MKKVLVLIMLIVVSGSVLFAQTTEKTLLQLNLEKEEAVKAENYQLAGDLKKQIEARENYLEAELKKAVENEDYEKAAAIKKELNGEEVKTEVKKEENQPEETTITDQESVKPEITQEKAKQKYSSKHGNHIYVGLLNHSVISYPSTDDIDEYNFHLQYMKFRDTEVISPAFGFQIGFGELSYEDDSYDYSESYTYIALGLGVSTNFGWKNNNTRFKPFAVSTLGASYEMYHTFTYYNYIDTDDMSDDFNKFKFNLNLKVGANFYMSEKVGLSFHLGYNRYTTIGLGVAF